MKQFIQIYNHFLYISSQNNSHRTIKITCNSLVRPPFNICLIVAHTNPPNLDFPSAICDILSSKYPSFKKYTVSCTARVQKVATPH